MANPFKRQVSAAASEALKELYSDDSDDSNKTGESEGSDLLAFDDSDQEEVVE